MTERPKPQALFMPDRPVLLWTILPRDIQNARRGNHSGRF
ncbi:hypothetical protein BACCAP_04273 [Pseudoflavonifractor capillosus ATCC 29799]|uniref:Uncharacterized protein n=1 Tax=Pseudoflavonifractor capillosus ATCC 29799 TaxID=411467 RepID=A6P1A6_9FIRM|nr:hypothetical protein BACCAP_04273 [Pseudoflavonifractor capillosus ATCC 29799]